jgi:hypothetical protein
MGETVDVIVLGEGRDQIPIPSPERSLQAENLARENAAAGYPRYS